MLDQLATRAGLAQFLRFGLVGVFNTTASYLTILVLADTAGVPLASAIGYTVGVLQSFLLNRFWTFNNARPDTHGRWRGEAVRFLAINVACGGLFTLVNSLASPHIGLLPATLAGVALVMPVGFLLNKFIVFR